MSDSKSTSIALFHQMLEFKRSNKITAISPVSVMLDLYNEIKVSPEELFTLAEKLIDGIYSTDEPFLYGERIAAVLTIVEEGFSDIPYMDDVEPDDAFEFLLHCSEEEFIAIVDAVAFENQGRYAPDWGPESGHDELMKSMNASVKEFLNKKPSLADKILEASSRSVASVEPKAKAVSSPEQGR